MPNLDDLTVIQALDRGHALESITMLPDQIDQSWQEGQAINFPPEYKNAKNIVIAGMGGSAYGGRIAKSLYDTKSKVPLELANGYDIPGFVDENSLVILSSYSGTTEETLTLARAALARKAKISGVTSGGELARFLSNNNFPSYIINPKYNPSQQPRSGVGYMVVGLLSLLSHLDYVSLDSDDVATAIKFLQEKGKSLDVSTPTEKNPAKTLAQKLLGFIPIIIVADFLEGAAHAIRNPFHETSKQFGLYFTIPELNHHLMDGLQFPQKGKKYLKFIFIKSDLYEERNKKRLDLTKDVVIKNGIETLEITLDSKTQFSQTMELIQFGGWLSFYLAIANGIDPSPVPWVDYFKKELVR
ncbi:SIS domain-containing protein [Candidatus Gottesmanbacteria bacterium]|nr:SIS domain-containing protein [Candidatus Gottesmanbacteria bacterium]